MVVINFFVVKLGFDKKFIEGVYLFNLLILFFKYVFCWFFVCKDYLFFVKNSCIRVKNVVNVEKLFWG